MVPVAGSAYTYAYATLGELFAWIIGWDLILEYAVASSTVAHGWSHYFQDFLAILRHPRCRSVVHATRRSTSTPPPGSWSSTGTVLRPAGHRHHAARHHHPGEGHQGERVVQRRHGDGQGRDRALRDRRRRLLRQPGELDAVRAVRPDRHQLLRQHAVRTDRPGGEPVGMLAGAAIVFFAYIGFDSVSTHAEEAKNPPRDVPIGIIVSLVLCTVLYIAVAAVLTGMVPLRPDQHRRAGLRRVQAGGPALGAAPDLGRRGGRHHVGAAGDDAQPAAHLPGHGARRPAADRLLRRRASAVPDALEVDDPHRHLRGDRWRRSCRCASWPSSSTSARCSPSSSSARRCSSCGRPIPTRSGRSARRSARSCRSSASLSCLLLMFSLPAENWVRLVVWLLIGLRHLLRLQPHHSVVARTVLNQPAGIVSSKSA